MIEYITRIIHAIRALEEERLPIESKLMLVRFIHDNYWQDMKALENNDIFSRLELRL